MADPSNEADMRADDFEAQVQSFLEQNKAEIRSSSPPSPPPPTSLAQVAEANIDFYTRVMDACKRGIEEVDSQLADIEAQAKTLFDSKQKLSIDRQRLASQRNAARIAMRHLEDSETRRQAAQG